MNQWFPLHQPPNHHQLMEPQFSVSCTDTVLVGYSTQLMRWLPNKECLSTISPLENKERNTPLWIHLGTLPGVWFTLGSQTEPQRMYCRVVLVYLQSGECRPVSWGPLAMVGNVGPRQWGQALPRLVRGGAGPPTSTQLLTPHTSNTFQHSRRHNTSGSIDDTHFDSYLDKLIEEPWVE